MYIEVLGTLGKAGLQEDSSGLKGLFRGGGGLSESRGKASGDSGKCATTYYLRASSSAGNWGPNLDLGVGRDLELFCEKGIN